MRSPGARWRCSRDRRAHPRPRHGRRPDGPLLRRRLDPGAEVPEVRPVHSQGSHAARGALRPATDRPRPRGDEASSSLGDIRGASTMTDNRSVKERIQDLLNRNQIDLDLYDFGDLVFDIGDLLASDVNAREPYAVNSVYLLREGGRSIQRRLARLEDGE